MCGEEEDIQTHVSVSLLTDGLGFLGSNAQAQAKHVQEKVVECDEGETVQSVLDGNFPSGPLTIQLVGTCPGFTITQNDISIVPFNDDVCPGGTLDDGIFMSGAHRIEIRCIAVTGGGAGEFEFAIELLL